MSNASGGADPRRSPQRKRRDGRSLFYRADLDGFRSLVGFLTRDCCCGRGRKSARPWPATLHAAALLPAKPEYADG